MTPVTKKIDLAEFYAMEQRGEFEDHMKVELIDGEVVEKPMQYNDHSLSIDQSHDALKQLFGPNFWVRSQATLDLLPHSAPDPDLAVVAGARNTHRGRTNPTTALLVVEVSGSTLARDRGLKSSLYAASAIQDYWIVNLEDRQLEIYRDPVLDADADFGWSYSSTTVLSEADFATPLCLPTSRVAVRDLLP